MTTGSVTQGLRQAWFEWNRKLRRKPLTLTFYHKVDDPYSFLLLQALPDLLNEYRVALDLQMVLDLPEGAEPVPQWRAHYALKDGQRLAHQFQLKYPQDPAALPGREHSELATSILLAQNNHPDQLQLALEVTEALWGVNTTTLQSCANRYGTLTESGTKDALARQRWRLQQAGHYRGGMLHCGYEWYWGLDRLPHLMDRLEQLQLRQSRLTRFDFSRYYQRYYHDYSTLKPRPKHTTVLDFYFAFYCPYSYLALERGIELAEHYRVPLHIKPVLKPANDNSIAPQQGSYDLEDARREAHKHGVAFAKTCTPTDTAVERCMALFDYAWEQKREKAFLVSVARGIWNEGADPANERQLSKLVERAGLDWQQAKSALPGTGWRRWARCHQEQLSALGLGGTPGFQYGDTELWGHDRLWVLEDAILNYEPNEQSTSA